MNPKTSWALVAVAALVFGFIFVYERHWRDDNAPPPAPRVLARIDPATLTSVQVRPAGQPEIRADRANGAWLLTRPLTYPAEGAAVDALIQALREVKGDSPLGAEELRSRRHPEKEFGLDPPRFSILLQEGEDVTQVLIGNLTPLRDQVFVQVVGLPGIYLADTGILRLIPHAAADWRSGLLMPGLKSLSFDRLVLTNRAGQWTLELQADPATRQWRLTAPLPARADSTKINALLDKLRDQRVSGFVSDDPKADLDAYGLQPPALSLALARGTNTVALIQLGRSATNAPGLIYVRNARLNAVLAAPAEPLAPWDAPVDEFRDRHLVNLPPELVDEIEVRGPENFTLQRVTNSVWRVAGTNGFAADPALMEDFLDNLGSLEVAEFVQGVVTPLGLPAYGLAPPVRQILLRTASTNAPTAGTNGLLAEVELGALRGDLVFARRADETAVYAVKYRDAARLPAVSWLLRDRRVFRFSEKDVTRLQLRREDRTLELLRTGPNQWTMPTNAPAGLNDLALDSALQQMGDLTCLGWVARAARAPATLGFTDAAPTLTIDFKTGPPVVLQFGGLSARGFPLAATSLAGEPTVFEVPWTVYQTLREALNLPPPQR